MIFKIEFPDKTEYCQAKDILHCLQAYDRDFEGFQDIKEVTEISDEEAKDIQVHNPEYDSENPDSFPEKVSLYDLYWGVTFEILASTEE